MSAEDVTGDRRADRAERFETVAPQRGAAGQPEPSQPTRIVIADDHTLFREALRLLLERQGNFRVVGAVVGGEAIEVVRKLTPDVVLIDMSVPASAGLQAWRELSDTGTGACMLLVTELGGEEIATALQLGARGVVLKDSTPECLFDSIRAVTAGRCWIGSESVPNLLQALRRRVATHDAARPQNQNVPYGLTARELEIIQWIVTGLANKAIARHLSITESTLKHHLTNIFDKLGVSDRLELALFSLHHNLVTISAVVGDE
jgi:two-component system nitrate/nitrite response regulator NarL